MMTPERKEEIATSHGRKDWYTLQQYIKELLAALEETEQQNVSLKAESLVSYCEAAKCAKELAEAQQTIARLTEAMEEIKSEGANAGYNKYYHIALNALWGGINKKGMFILPNCPTCNSTNTLSHPNKAGIWLCVSCDKVFEEGEQPLGKELRQMHEPWKCMECQTPIEYEPEYCCDGRECGCMGQPIEPPLCAECWKRILGDMSGSDNT